MNFKSPIIASEESLALLGYYTIHTPDKELKFLQFLTSIGQHFTNTVMTLFHSHLGLSCDELHLAALQTHNQVVLPNLHPRDRERVGELHVGTEGANVVDDAL